MKTVNDFSGKVLSAWVEIYHTNLSEREREVRIRNLPNQLFSEFDQLYKATFVTREISEKQILDRARVVQHGAGAISYEVFKRDMDNNRLLEMSNFYRLCPSLYREYIDKYRNERARQN